MVSRLPTGMTLAPTRNVEVTVASGEDLDVRHYHVAERLSALFEISLHVACRNHDLDFSGIIGQPAALRVHAEASPGAPARVWTGICSRLQQVGTEGSEAGVSIYHLTLVPALWLSTQRRNYRMFQHASELEIARRLLSEWGIEPLLELAPESYKKRKYRVQYAESDFTFLRRMLEDAGITFFFRQVEEESRLVLAEAPQTTEPRANALPYVDHASLGAIRHEHARHVLVGQEVRPGRYTMRDHDYRRAPTAQPEAAATAAALGVEARLERYHYVPGAFLFGADRGEETPHADDRGMTRTDEREASRLAERRLSAQRADAWKCSFETNALDLSPGVVMRLSGHPRADLGPERRLLVTETSLQGAIPGESVVVCHVVSAEQPYRPALETPKPRVSGIESATVVGPRGEEIHCDEFGRVRVHFHWDRESQRDERSSCWLHVSQPWGGSGYGMINVPRVGQEVLVDFLGGDPDRPIVVGRVHTNHQRPPYGLPAARTQSGWRSSSSPASGGYNEIMFEDAAGAELMRVRAERDQSTDVQRNATTNIGNDRSIFVGRNDQLCVGENRTMIVNKNLTELVNGEQRTTVTENILTDCTDGSTIFRTKETFYSEAKSHELVSADRILLRVGEAILLMQKDCILLQAPNVFINPGQELAARAVGTGERPITPEEEEQAAAQRREEARQRVLAEATNWLRAQMNTDEARAAAIDNYGPQTRNWLRGWQNERDLTPEVRAARNQLNREELAGVHDQVFREFQERQGVTPSAPPPRPRRGSR